MIREFNILNVKVSAINMNDAVKFVENSIREGKKTYVSVCPVGTIIACQKNNNIKNSVNSAGLVTPDGMPVVWIGRRKGFSGIERVYGPDLMLEVCRLSQENGYRNYFYGSSKDVLSRLQANLKQMFPDLAVAGFYSPPFRKLFEEEDELCVEAINKNNTDILWVGLGSPKQDLWMYEHRSRISAQLMLGVGAAFDFIAGTKRQAPAWMQRSGLEWVFRMITEPRRLWKRYLVGNSLFLWLLCKKFIKTIILRKKSIITKKGDANER